MTSLPRAGGRGWERRQQSARPEVRENEPRHVSRRSKYFTIQWIILITVTDTQFIRTSGPRLADRSASRVFNQIEIWSKLQITFYKLSLESVDISQGVRERARVPQLVMLCRQWAHLQCFAGRTGHTHDYCVAGKHTQYHKIRPLKKN